MDNVCSHSKQRKICVLSFWSFLDPPSWVFRKREDVSMLMLKRELEYSRHRACAVRPPEATIDMLRQEVSTSWRATDPQVMSSLSSCRTRESTWHLMSMTYPANTDDTRKRSTGGFWKRHPAIAYHVTSQKLLGWSCTFAGWLRIGQHQGAFFLEPALWKVQQIQART